MSTENKPSRSNTGASLRNSDVAVRMAVIIGLGAVIGRYLDNKFHSTQSIYTIVCCLVAIIGALYWVIKDLTKK